MASSGTYPSHQPLERASDAMYMMPYKAVCDYTVLLERSLRAWAEHLHLLPHSQNAFRSGYRNNDNIFIFATK